MFHHLTGIVVLKDSHRVILDVAGIGYEVFISFQTYQNIPECDHKFTIYTHPHYREDSQKLFGFSTLQEKELFVLILSVNGIGPKVALAILSTFSEGEFRRIICSEDISQIVRVPGIGQKSARRLVIEMKDKCLSWEQSDRSEEPKELSDDLKRDVIFALVSLGYKEKQARKSFEQVQKTCSSEEEWVFENVMKKCLSNCSNMSV